ncbi:serine/threonine protein kinase [Myxococcus llanfairpwllgwyngyllgogerychwyrndrobwllllantysiliogogogochensis]|uniref:serine/threonine protein kinase n=1 Tax=Myxococcus llanfairpwllgwyngyllgogerychwyrndrobwllllantysiliogogogochensis TaxID=2590453 RepID=UPI001FE58C71|nr:serine/threonine-protein kinase [Myxococcus llanfairpwllgwyngyllgogerychwyrndrobwllllantysiliogogogochensis]
MLTVIHHPAQFPPGHVVHGWRVVKLVGAGSYGAVYKVEMNGKHYAMKVAMHRATSGDEEKADARLRRELGCLVHLRHSNIIASRAYGRWPDFESGWLYVILDFVDGFTLAEWVEKVHPTAQEVVRLFIKLSAAVDYMHGRGVFHRDLKLNNVMVRASDNEPFIIDFSAGDYTHAEDLTDAPLPPGTRRYRSPEASRFLRESGDDRDARYDFKVTDDVYALGVCLYDALTNPQPASDSAKTPVEGRAMPPDPRVLNDRVPGALSDAAMRFIARKPEHRPPTAEAVRRELMALAIDSGPEWVTPLHTLTAKPLLTPASEPEGATKRATPRRGLLLGALGTTLAIAALVGLFASKLAGQESSAMASVEPSAQRDAGTGAPLLVVAPQEDAGMPLGTGVVSPAPVASSPGIALSPQAPVQKESPSVKRAPIVASTSESPAMKAPASSGGRAEFLKKCAAATAVVALQMGCPGSQVRPGPSECPEEAREAMFEVLGFFEGNSVVITIDKNQPGAMSDSGVYADGPVRGIVRDGVDTLPTGTVLQGRVWTGGGALLARYTEARLPNGRSYPVCISIGEKGAEEAEPGPQPGTVTFSRSMYGYAVKEWP